MLLLKTYKPIEELIYKAFYNRFKKQSFLNLSNADENIISRSAYRAMAYVANFANIIILSYQT